MERIYLFLHVLGAVLFLGNIMTTAFWKIRQDRSHSPEALHHMAISVMRADYVFTVPGIVLLAVFGTLTALSYGYSFTELNWLTISLSLFAVSGLLWGTLLLPSQLQMVKLSKVGIESGVLPAEYYRHSRHWNVWGTVNTVIPLIILFLMVVKP